MPIALTSLRRDLRLHSIHVRFMAECETDKETIMNVKEVMTPQPACCTSDASLQEAANLMVEHDCGCIPVVDGKDTKKPIGMITDRDITTRAVALGKNPLELKVS